MNLYEFQIGKNLAESEKLSQTLIHCNSYVIPFHHLIVGSGLIKQALFFFICMQ